MARTPTISNDQILDAARGLFMEHGFGVSTAAIARAAGVSEGSIFRRFPSKAALFFEALRPAAYEELVRFIDGLTQAPSARDGMEALVVEAVQKLRYLLPHSMMLWANTSPADFKKTVGEHHPVTILRKTEDWLRAEVSKGRLQVEDPHILARVLLGSSLHFVFFETLGMAEPADERDFARRLGHLLLPAKEDNPS